MKKINFSNPDLERKVLSFAPRCGYKAIEDSNGRWIENNLTKMPYEYVRISASNIDDAQSLISSYQSEYDGFKEYKTSYSSCSSLLASITKDISPENIDLFKRGINFCPRARLHELFKECVAPRFFGVFPKGEIIISKTSSVYYARASFIRMLYTLAQYPDITKSKEIKRFAALAYWNSIEPDNFLSAIISINQYLFYPYISAFHAMHGVALDFIFIPDKPIEYKPGPFPSNWLDFLKSKSDFAKEKSEEIKSVEELFRKPLRSIHSKHVFKDAPTHGEITELFVWAINSTNRMAQTIYDVTTFLTKDDPDTIDPIYAFEYAHSLMHIFKNAISITLTDQSYQNKATTFRIADILSCLAKHGSLGKNEDDFFKGLFRCDVGKPLISGILYSSNVNALKIFADETGMIYENLKDAILSSVWVPAKITHNGVLIKKKTGTGETEISKDEFCGNVIRRLRNTHHGYLTRGDQSLGPSRYLALVDGNTRDDFPTLAIAWVLSVVAYPEKMIGNP